MEKVSKGGLKMSVYGRPKTGKTRLLATFPKPLLILGTEDGTESIKRVKGVNFVRVIGERTKPPKDGSYVRLSELDSFLKHELPESDYATAGLDGGSGLQDLIYADIMGMEDAPLMKSAPTKDQNVLYSGRTRGILRELIRLPMNVVVVSHEKNFQEEGGDSELLTPMVSSSLSGAVCRYLNGEVDYICQTFIRDKTVARESTVAGKTTTVELKTGKAEYCLRIGQHPVYVTGFRLPDPDYELPDVIVDPTYEKIAKVIRGEDL